MTDASSVDSAPDSGAAAGDGPLALTGRLTINEAEAVRDALLNHMARCGTLTLDLGALEAVDVAGLQLLISARRSAERAGKTLKLAAAPGAALLEALTAAGFCSVEDGGQPQAGQDGFWWGRS